jgi:hypothetical protein
MTKDNQDVIFQKLIDKHLKDNPHLFILQAFDNTCRNKSLSDDKIKVLKDELGKDIVVQVEEADRRKPILLVGSNDAIIKGTLALIWNTHPLIPKVKPLRGSGNDRVFFLDKNCSGLSEEEIKRELFHKSELSDEEREEHFLDHECIELIKPLINVYKRGYVMLSLRGLEDKQHKNVLKRLGVIKEGYRRDLFGVLVVGIDSTDNLPQDLNDQFEVISLKSIQNDIQIAKTTEKKITKAFYDDEKGILFLNDKYCELSKDGRSLIELLKKYIHDVAEIIYHFQDTKDSWGRGTFDTLVSRVNRKCRERLGIKKLIMNEGRGSSQYCLSVEVADRKFKMDVQKT